MTVPLIAFLSYAEQPTIQEPPIESLVTVVMQNIGSILGSPEASVAGLQGVTPQQFMKRFQKHLKCLNNLLDTPRKLTFAKYMSLDLLTDIVMRVEIPLKGILASPNLPTVGNIRDYILSPEWNNLLRGGLYTRSFLTVPAVIPGEGATRPPPPQGPPPREVDPLDKNFSVIVAQLTNLVEGTVDDFALENYRNCEKKLYICVHKFGQLEDRLAGSVEPSDIPHIRNLRKLFCGKLATDDPEYRDDPWRSGVFLRPMGDADGAWNSLGAWIVDPGNSATFGPGDPRLYLPPQRERIIEKMLVLETQEEVRAAQAAIDQEKENQNIQQAYEAATRDPVLVEIQEAGSWLDSMDSEDVVKDTAQAEQIEATLQTISAQMESVRLESDSEDHFFEPL